MTTDRERNRGVRPCTCRGPVPEDPCGHGDTSEGCPRHDPNYDPDEDEHGNRVRREGYDRCYCGCKYWEHDRCVDCGGTEPEDPEAALARRLR